MALPDVQQITTADADPTLPPYRISDKPGKNIATVVFDFTAAGPVLAWRMVTAGNRLTGRRLASQGVVCGLDRCGTGRALARDPGSPVTVDLTQAELGPEGDYPIDVHGLDAEGWD